MTCNFTLAHYKEILLLAKKRGYAFSDFSTKPTLAQKRIYLRHDVEVSLDNALEMAEIEKEEGVRSTYFIFIESPSYNIFNDAHQKIIKKIALLGHEVGIHYEWKKGQSKESMAQEVLNYYKFLKAFSFPIKKIVSFHRPALKAQGKVFSQFINAYEPNFLGTTKESKTKYISDSNGKWQEDCACAFLEKPSYQNLQVLTHPMWWNEKNLSKKDIYDKLVKRQEIHIKGWLKSNIKGYETFFTK